jgi:hypothetical protein
LYITLKKQFTKLKTNSNEGKLNMKHDYTHLIIVLDAKRDQIFTAAFENRNGKAAVREPARLPFVDDGKLRGTLVDLWAGGSGLAIVEIGGADVSFTVESHAALWSALERPLDVVVAVASFRA